MSTLPCAKCGAVLDTSQSSPGTWLSCPGCGQPVQVRARPLARPTPPPPLPEELLDVAWASDPRLEKRPPASTHDEPPRAIRTPPGEQRVGLGQIFMLAGLAGVAQAMFVGSFLMIVNPWELFMCAAFGAMVAAFVAVMVNTMRWGGSEERRGPL